MSPKNKGFCNHKRHKRMDINIHLNGKFSIDDIPAIPKRLSCKFPLRIFDHRPYENTEGYCPADCELSRSLYVHSTWETFETVLFLDILNQKHNSDYVIDCGSNVGWYSILAALNGYTVYAYDNDADYMNLFKINTKPYKDIHFKLHKITAKSKLHLADASRQIKILKSDVEGDEIFVFKAYKKAFETKKIDYAMFEISPIFNDTYPDLVEAIADCSYDVYKIPTKGFKFLNEYSENPLEIIREHCRIPAKNRREYVESLRQENFLFIKNNL